MHPSSGNSWVLLLNGGFCKGCITKRCCLTQEICHIMNLYHKRSMRKAESNNILNIFCHVHYNICFLLKEKHVRAKSVLWWSSCRIHHYVAAPLLIFPFSGSLISLTLRRFFVSCVSLHRTLIAVFFWGCIQRKWCMGPYVGVDHKSPYVIANSVVSYFFYVNTSTAKEGEGVRADLTRTSLSWLDISWSMATPCLSWL